jgi:hypothetical protein
MTTPNTTVSLGLAWLALQSAERTLSRADRAMFSAPIVFISGRSEWRSRSTVCSTVRVVRVELDPGPGA